MRKVFIHTFASYPLDSDELLMETKNIHYVISMYREVGEPEAVAGYLIEYCKAFDESIRWDLGGC